MNTTHGMTLKQAAKVEFFDALEAYKKAKVGPEFIRASVRLHIDSGGVPKSFRRLVTAAYKERKG